MYVCVFGRNFTSENKFLQKRITYLFTLILLYVLLVYFALWMKSAHVYGILCARVHACVHVYVHECVCVCMYHIEACRSEGDL